MRTEVFRKDGLMHVILEHEQDINQKSYLTTKYIFTHQCFATSFVGC